MFEPYTQNVWPSLALMRVVIRANAAPAAVIGAARQTIHEIDPGLPLANVSSLAALTDTAMAGERFSMLLVGSFGFLAVFLAAVGVYGVVSYSAARRTREIGLRIALGAQRSHIFGLIIRRAVGLSGIGIVCGLIAALGMGRILTGFLYDVSPADPLTFAAVSVFLIAVAIGASYIPARKAAAIDPLEALRIE